MVPGPTLEEAEAAAERIRSAIGNLRIPALSEGPAPHVTASVGISSLGPAPDDATRLLARADQAMYRAKAAGRNRCERASPATIGD
jgi:diguanylate cyclase (GGDEF)-like protein